MKRKIIRIDDEKCNGCGLCIPDCPEGALQMIDGKARLISDLFCDGLGACIGSCPEGAITVEEREAEPYDETKVMANIVRQGPNVIKAHLEHLEDHGQDDLVREAMAYLVENDIEIPEGALSSRCGCNDLGPVGGGSPAAGPHGPAPCPGSRAVSIDPGPPHPVKGRPAPAGNSMLRQWPVQIMLVPVSAPFFDGADLLFAADCVPFAYAGFHEKLLKGRICLVGCPKLDDAGHYTEKITEIFRQNEIKSIMIAYMEVPCCGGMMKIVEEALKASGKNIPVARQKISIRGDEM
jgi:ferredoxin